MRVCYAVALIDVISYSFPEIDSTFGVLRVSTRWTWPLRLNLSAPILGVLTDSICFEQLLAKHSCHNLPVKGNCSLSNFLGISNVQCSSLLELEIMFLLQHFVDLFTSEWDCTTHCVSGIKHIVADTVEDWNIFAHWSLLRLKNGALETRLWGQSH